MVNRKNSIESKSESEITKSKKCWVFEIKQTLHNIISLQNKLIGQKEKATIWRKKSTKLFYCLWVVEKKQEGFYICDFCFVFTFYIIGLGSVILV